MKRENVLNLMCESLWFPGPAETLAWRTRVIEKNLKEKLQIFAFYSEELTGMETPQKRLLLRGTPATPSRGRHCSWEPSKMVQAEGLKVPYYTTKCECD